jgi:hypothetical protein
MMSQLARRIVRCFQEQRKVDGSVQKYKTKKLRTVKIVCYEARNVVVAAFYENDKLDPVGLLARLGCMPQRRPADFFIKLPMMP